MFPRHCTGCFWLEILLLCLLSSGCSSNSEWHAYENEDLGFRINFPSKPIVSDAGGTEEDVTRVRANVDRDGMAYVVLVSTVESNSMSPEQSLQKMERLWTLPEKISSNDITVNGNQIREIIQPHESVGSRIRKQWLLASPGRWYSIYVVADSEEQLSSEKVTNFLHSFELITPNETSDQEEQVNDVEDGEVDSPAMDADEP